MLMTSQLYGGNITRISPNYSQIFSTSNTTNGTTRTFSNISIGDPEPNRKLIMHFVNEYLPGTLNFSCTVNGVQADLLYTMLANGSVLSTQFTSYSGREILYLSQDIPTGNTANIVFSAGLTTATITINVIKGVDMYETNDFFNFGEATNAVTLNMPPKCGAFFQTGGADSVTISNTTRRMNVLSGGTYHRSFDYFNTSDTEQTVTFTRSASGTVRYRVFY